MQLKNFMEGLKILSKGVDETTYPMCAAHDEFFFHTNQELDQSDIDKLKELGWMEWDDPGSWHCFM